MREEREKEPTDACDPAGYRIERSDVATLGKVRKGKEVKWMLDQSLLFVLVLIVIWLTR